MMSLKCPACGYEMDATAVRWGDGRQKLAVAPFICSQCAAASIINLVTMTVESVPPENWEVVKAHNPELWAAITRVQQNVRAARKGSPQ